MFSTVERHPDHLVLGVPSKVYSEAALFRACYLFTGRCYLFLRPGAGDVVLVEFRRKKIDADLDALIGEFANELIAQKLRADLAHETRAIREIIVAQAFAEADLP